MRLAGFEDGVVGEVREECGGFGSRESLIGWGL
jgi:hypothetical protein